jgi:long-chain fatty acid transport protein
MKKIIISSVSLFTVFAAQATNGYFAHGYGNANRALAGAGTAVAFDAISSVNNPASALQVNDQLQLELSIFNPKRGHTVTGQMAPPPAFSLALGEVESDRERFFIPGFGWKTSLDEQSSLNIVVYGNGGMNTEYPTSVFYGSNAGVDLAQLFISFGYARQMNDDLAIGVAPIFAAQRFAATGLEAFGQFSANPQAVSNKGHEITTGFGAKFGVTYDVSDTLTLGLSYQTKIAMEDFSDYAGLFAEQGGFDIPSSISISTVYTFSDNALIALDWQKINYSEVASIANAMMPNLMQAQLGQDNGAGFGWRDMDIVKLGYQFGIGETIYRLGVSYGEQPIPESEMLFNILSPGVQEIHYTAGIASGRWSADIMYSPNNNISGANALTCDPISGQCAQNIELEMSQLQFSIGYRF